MSIQRNAQSTRHILLFLLALSSCALASLAHAQTIPLDTSNWRYWSEVSGAYLAPARGVFEVTPEGLRMFGDGFRTSPRAHTVSSFVLKDKVLHLKWKADGAGTYMSVMMYLATNISAPYEGYPAPITWYLPTSAWTTAWQYSSILIPDQTWHFTRVAASATEVRSITARDNYDNLGGVVVDDVIRPVAGDTPVSIVFGVGDNYGGTAASVTMGEARIEPQNPLGPARLWVGLKNSDDQGTQFDVRVELYKNATTLLSAGETLCVTNVPRNSSLAKQVETAFADVAPESLSPGDRLSFRVLTRIGTNPDGTKCTGPGGSHNNAVGLRLYYDAVSRPSRFAAETSPNPLSGFFLHFPDAFDAAAPTASSPRYKDSSGLNFAGGNGWKEVGTWGMTVP